MIIQEITDYVDGNMDEEEALDLWVHLITHPDDMELLEFYLMCKEYFTVNRDQ